MDIPALRQKLAWAAAEYSKANLWLYATSGAYYMFFSLGPLVVLLLGLLPYLPFTQQQLSDAILSYAPAPLQELVRDLVAGVYAGSAAALGVGLVVELWSAGRFFSLILRGISQIYDGRHNGGYLRNRLMGALYTAALIALVLGNVTLIFAGEKLLPIARLWAVLVRFRGLIFFAVVTAVNALLFRTVPKKKLAFRRQLPGAAISAALWLAFSQAYSWAVERFSFYSIYGGLAIVIISLFWMYCSLYLLFLGAWLNTLKEKAHEA